MVEASKSCDINRGEYVKRVKSTKFVKQILSTYATIVVISRFAKQFAACSQKETAARSFQPLDNREILRAKRQGGGG
jgi:hypothetical protein